MPSSNNLPSSFASAAAGQNTGRDARGGRADGRGSAAGDWSRRDGRSANGTLTFRRSSTTPIGQSSQPPPPVDNAVQPASAADAMSVQQSAFEPGPSRYTKEDFSRCTGPPVLATIRPGSLFLAGILIMYIITLHVVGESRMRTISLKSLVPAGRRMEIPCH